MIRYALLIAASSLVMASPTLARERQFYGGINAGVSFPDQVKVDIDRGRPDGLQENAAFADTKLGLDADIVLGYDFGVLRLEAEGGYKRNGYKRLTVVNPALVPGTNVAPGTVVGNERDLSIWSGMLNGLLEVGNDDGLQIFAGGGVGLAHLQLPVRVPGVGAVIDDSSTDFAWQLLAGARVALSPKVDLGLKYRFFNINDFRLTGVAGQPLQADYQAHSLLASLSYNFGSKPAPTPAAAPPPAPPPPPPPPAAVAPPPPPPPVCNTGPYIVFFDFDSAAITAEAGAVLANAITAYGNCGGARVMLAGHTDRAGSARYNMGLAARRNAAVAEYMTTRGVPASSITSEAFGESMPRVPTADGVREPQNRRVEITYGPGSGM